MYQLSNIRQFSPVCRDDFLLYDFLDSGGGMDAPEFPPAAALQGANGSATLVGPSEPGRSVGTPLTAGPAVHAGKPDDKRGDAHHKRGVEGAPAPSAAVLLPFKRSVGDAEVGALGVPKLLAPPVAIPIPVVGSRAAKRSSNLSRDGVHLVRAGVQVVDHEGFRWLVTRVRLGTWYGRRVSVYGWLRRESASGPCCAVSVAAPRSLRSLQAEPGEAA